MPCLTYRLAFFLNYHKKGFKTIWQGNQWWQRFGPQNCAAFCHLLCPLVVPPTMMEKLRAGFGTMKGISMEFHLGVGDSVCWFWPSTQRSDDSYHLVEKDSNSLILYLGDGFKDFLCSPLYLQRWSNLTNICFQRGWFKQQLDNMCYIIDQWIISVHIIPTMKTPPYVSSNLILQRIEVWWFTKVILKPWVSLPWISYPWHLASGTSLRFSDVGWKWWFLVSFPIISLVGYTRGDRNFTSWKITFFVKISWIYVWCMEIWWPQKKINLRFRGGSRPPYVFYFTVSYSVKGMGWKGKYLNQPSDKAVWGMLALPSSLHDDIWRPRRLSDTLRCFMAILEPCCKVGF